MHRTEASGSGAIPPPLGSRGAHCLKEHRLRRSKVSLPQGKAASRLGFSFSELQIQEAQETNTYSGSQQTPTDAGAFVSPIAHTCSYPGASLLELGR